MQNLQKWLSDEVRGERLARLIVFLLVFQFIYVVVAVAVLQLFGVPLLDDGGIELPNISLVQMLLFIPIAACIEELVFRFIPLALAVKMKWPLSRILVLAVIVSMVFGFGHGGYPFIFIQGVIGFTWCLLFLKAGGMHGRPMKALMATTTSHALYNFTIYTIGYISSNI